MAVSLNAPAPFRRLAVTLWCATVSIVLSPALAGAEVCIPSPVVRALGKSERVRIVRVGAPGERLPGPSGEATGGFMGCRRLESFEVVGRMADMLTKVFADRGHLSCWETQESEPEGSRRGVLGVELDAPGGQVRVLLYLPDGGVEIGLAGGERHMAALSTRARTDWKQFLAEFTGERRSTPSEFLKAMFEAQAIQSAAVSSLPEDATLEAIDSLRLAAEQRESGAECTPPVLGAPNPVMFLPGVRSMAAPVYPDRARESGVDGTVELHVLVDCRGVPSDIRVKRSTPMLDDAAVAAVYNWRFFPARRYGHPVACWTEVPVKFSLH